MTNLQFKTFLETNNWKQDVATTPTFPEMENEIWCKKFFGVVDFVLNCTTISIHGNAAKFVSVDIKMEKDGIWYNLQAYSISPKEFIEKHVEIEDKLIALWSMLCL